MPEVHTGPAEEGDGVLMLVNYIDWDDVAIKALRRHEENRVALMNLREEYAAITDGLGAVDYGKDRVDGSNDADSGMVNRLLQKEAIKGRIRMLAQEERQYDRAWGALSEDERFVLTEFFQKGRRYTEDAVEAVCNRFHCERRTAFTKRKRAIDRFKRYLVG